MADFIRKLKNKKGATLFFALFLMLVIFAVESVVLTAATAAAGRHSQREDLDDKYYRVSSAIELLQDKLDGYTVESYVQKTTTTVVTRDASEEAEDGEKITTATTTDYEGQFEGGPIKKPQSGIADILSYSLLYGGYSSSDSDVLEKEAFDSGFKPKAVSDDSCSFRIINNSAETENLAYVEYAMDNNGKIVFTVTSDKDGDYIIGQAYFSAHVEEKQPIESNINGEPQSDGMVETTISQSIITKPVTVTWVFEKFVQTAKVSNGDTE